MGRGRPPLCDICGHDTSGMTLSRTPALPLRSLLQERTLTQPAAISQGPAASSQQPGGSLQKERERERACARAIFEAETCWAPAPGPAVASAGLWAQAIVAALLVSSPGRFQRRRAIPLRQTAVAARQAAVARRVTELITEDRLTLPCKHGHGRSSGPSGRVFTRSRSHSDCADL